MARLLWSVLCTKSVVDSRTNNVSLIEIIDQLNFTEELPEERNTVPFSAELATVWMRSEIEVPEVFMGRFQFIAPSDEELGESQFELDLSEHIRIRYFIRLNALPIVGFGTYNFVVSHRDAGDDGWMVDQRTPLDVALQVD